VLIISLRLLNTQHCRYEAGYDIVRMINKEGCKDEAYKVKEFHGKEESQLDVKITIY